MFYITFKLLYLEAYIPVTETTERSWLTEALQNLNLISNQATHIANPIMVNYILLLVVAVFLTYTVFTLLIDEWFAIKPNKTPTQHTHTVLFDRTFYVQDNALLDKELQQKQNIVVAIDDVSLFLNVDLLEICSKNHFVLLCDDILERFQHAMEIVKSSEMRERYEEIITQLTENLNVRSKVIYYKCSDDIARQYYLDQSYAVDKFLASCISAAKDDALTIKIVSRNDAIISKAKQLGFSTFKLSSMIDESKEVNVWETEENRGIVH